METNGDEFLTKKELAARLKVSVRTVEQWQHDGHIPYLRVAGVLLFHWPAVVSALTEKFTIRRGGNLSPQKSESSHTTLTRPADTLSRSRERGTGGEGSATPVRADEKLKAEILKAEIGAEGKAQGGKR